MTFNVRLELPALNIPGIGKVVRSPTNSKQGPVLGFILSLLKPQLELEMIGAFRISMPVQPITNTSIVLNHSHLCPFIPPARFPHPRHQVLCRPTCLRPTLTSS